MKLHSRASHQTLYIAQQLCSELIRSLPMAVRFKDTCDKFINTHSHTCNLNQCDNGIMGNKTWNDRPILNYRLTERLRNCFLHCRFWNVNIDFVVSRNSVGLKFWCMETKIKANNSFLINCCTKLPKYSDWWYSGLSCTFQRPQPYWNLSKHFVRVIHLLIHTGLSDSENLNTNKICRLDGYALSARG